MRSASLALAGVVLLSAALTAQGDAPPADVGGCWQLVAEFDPTKATNPFTTSNQIHMIPADRPGKFWVGVTCAGLLAANGGKGGGDILTGEWYAPLGPNPARVVWDKANAHTSNPINTPNNEFGFTMLDSGTGLRTYAVWDDITGRSLALAYYDNAAKAWLKIPVNTPAGYVGDPSIGNIDGKTWLFYILGINIAAIPITLTPTKGTVPLSQAVTLITGVAQAHSPTPIVDNNGNVTGFSHHETGSGDSDHYFSFDLLSSTASVKPLTWDTTPWSNNGGFAGGRIFDAHSGPPSTAQACAGNPAGYRIYSRDVYFCAGGRAQIGNTMPIHAYVAPGFKTGITSVFFMGLAYLTPCVKITPWGCLGVNPSFLLPLGAGAHSPLTGQASIIAPIPNDAGLKGFTLPMMSLAIDANLTRTPPFWLSNSAAFTISPN